jgi:hypothetical protein
MVNAAYPGYRFGFKDNNIWRGDGIGNIVLPLTGITASPASDAFIEVYHHSKLDSWYGLQRP